MSRLDKRIHAGYQLLHDGILELSRIEANGMRVDVDYLDRAITKTGETMKRLQGELMQDKVWRLWRRRYGLDASLTKREQLAAILFEELKYTSKAKTEGEKYAMDESALEGVDDPFVKSWLRYMKLDKALGTYLLGIRREVVNGRIHPVFNLHTTVTYRSSSDTPNFQNMPIRNAEIGKLIRQCFIASEGCVIVENDFKGVEVSVAACYHKDPVMITYIKDETKDMHRDMAMEIYFLVMAEWAQMEAKKYSKPVRHAAKNKFVFPEFYGDWWKSCAEALWESIDRDDLKGPDGNSLREHLKARGIKGLGTMGEDNRPKPGTFYFHLKKVEDDFWNKRFKVYNKWKKEWYNRYLSKGYFDTYTGFRIAGAMDRKQVINYPVQGSAFHCLLWSLIRINRELRRRKMKSKIVGQIHDSLVADVRIDELDTYLAIVRQVTEKDIMEAQKWLLFPLVIECEICPIGKSWHEKREVKINKAGQYESKDGKFKGTAEGLLRHWQTEDKALAA